MMRECLSFPQQTLCCGKERRSRIIEGTVILSEAKNLHQILRFAQNDSR